MAIQVIVNPQAGKRAGKRLFPIIQKKLQGLGLIGEIAFSNHPQEACQLAKRAQEKGYKLILACGGDGTIHSLLPALIYKPIALGVIPIGTANDLARHWQIPLHINQALDLLVSGQVKAVDIIATKSGKFIAGSGGLGFDVAVIERARAWRRYWRGLFPYIAAIFVEFFRYSLPVISLTTESWHYMGPAWQIIFSKMAQYAKGVKIPGRVRKDDGLMAISLIPALSKYQILSRFFYFPFTGIQCIPQSIHLTAPKIIIRSQPARKYHGDGEVVGITPETFQVLPKALQIISPPGA